MPSKERLTRGAGWGWGAMAVVIIRVVAGILLAFGLAFVDYSII